MKITIMLPSEKHNLVEPILKGLQALIGKDFKMSVEEPKHPIKVKKHPEDMNNRELTEHLEEKLRKKYNQ